MPITGRKAADCFHTFREHLGQVLAATLGDEHPVLVRQDGPNKATLSLGPSNQLAGVRLASARGPFYFSMRQNLEAVAIPGKIFQLKTREYRYAIAETDNELSEALMRWDYIAHVPEGKQWCKHHFQLGRVNQRAITASFGQSEVDFNRVHTPTGFVLVEYVLRFLLTDMSVQPASSDWETVLGKSEGKFFNEFSGRTS